MKTRAGGGPLVAHLALRRIYRLLSPPEMAQRPQPAAAGAAPDRPGPEAAAAG